MLEGGIRVPMLVKWPGKIKPGTQTDYQIIIEDFYPSILEMAGITEIQTVQTIDGEKFNHVLEGNVEGLNERALVWHYPNEWGPTGPGIGAASTIRQGDWKLIYFHADRRMELYNIAEDIGESVNRASDEPEKLRELAKALSDKLRAVDAQMPLYKKMEKLCLSLMRCCS